MKQKFDNYEFHFSYTRSVTVPFPVSVEIANAGTGTVLATEQFTSPGLSQSALSSQCYNWAKKWVYIHGASHAATEESKADTEASEMTFCIERNVAPGNVKYFSEFIDVKGIDEDGYLRHEDGLCFFIDALAPPEALLPGEFETDNPEPIHILDERVLVTSMCYASAAAIESAKTAKSEAEAKAEAERLAGRAPVKGTRLASILEATGYGFGYLRCTGRYEYGPIGDKTYEIMELPIFHHDGEVDREIDAVDSGWKVEDTMLRWLLQRLPQKGWVRVQIDFDEITEEVLSVTQHDYDCKGIFVDATILLPPGTTEHLGCHIQPCHCE